MTMADGSGETMVCPRCSYETTRWDDETLRCPECPPTAGNVLRAIVHDVPGGAPILEPKDGEWSVEVTTRGDVMLCPKCGEPVDEIGHKTETNAIAEPCGCLILSGQ